jgi:uncharacterized protein YceK
MVRSLLALLLICVLTGCSTVANNLSPEQIGSFRLAAVNVRYADDARISWSDGANSYAASKGVDADSPETRAYVRSTIASKITSVMQRRVGDRLVGSRPVRIDVVVKTFMIPPIFMRVVGSNHQTFTAEVNLVDAKSGDVLASNPDVYGFVAASPGVVGELVARALFDEPIDHLLDSFGRSYRLWLLRAT